jgi:hypothetical protein
MTGPHGVAVLWPVRSPEQPFVACYRCPELLSLPPEVADAILAGEMTPSCVGCALILAEEPGTRARAAIHPRMAEAYRGRGLLAMRLHALVVNVVGVGRYLRHMRRASGDE